MVDVRGLHLRLRLAVGLHREGCGLERAPNTEPAGPGVDTVAVEARVDGRGGVGSVDAAEAGGRVIAHLHLVQTRVDTGDNLISSLEYTIGLEVARRRPVQVGITAEDDVAACAVVRELDTTQVERAVDVGLNKTVPGSRSVARVDVVSAVLYRDLALREGARPDEVQDVAVLVRWSVRGAAGVVVVPASFPGRIQVVAREDRGGGGTQPRWQGAVRDRACAQLSADADVPVRLDR